MKERKPAVIPASYLSPHDRDYAQRMGILREPKWRTLGQNTTENVVSANPNRNGRLDLGDSNVLPAGNIRSGWRMNVESRTGTIRRMR